jgi:hypothetical protein
MHYLDKKTELTESLKRKPTVKEILAECNTSRPSEEDGRKAINAVINFFLLADLEKSTLAANNANVQAGNDVDLDKVENAKLTFRSTAIVRKKLAEQLKHVACLMPPPNVVLHYEGANGKIYRAGQSSKNEVLHQNCNRAVFAGTRVGIAKAERSMYTFLDNRDEMQNAERRNAENHYTTNIESKAVANSVALDVGYEEPPFKDTSLPGTTPTKELFGFEEPGDKSADPQTMEQDEESLQDNDDENVQEREQEEDADRAVGDAVDMIHIGFQAVLSRSIGRRDSTFDAFFKLTGGNPSVPFNIDGNEDSSKEEIRLFQELSPKYKRHIAPGQKEGYNAFLKEWTLLAGTRRVERFQDDSVLPIFGKTLRMLQDCYDKLKARKDASLEANPAAVRREEGLRQVFREIRQSVHAPAVSKATPEQFPIDDPINVPAGNPFTLNPEAAMARVGRKGKHSSAPYDVQVEHPPKRRHVDDSKPAPRKLPQGLTFNIVCKSCGRRRSEHAGAGGSSFSSNCSFTSCARCGLHKWQHGTLIPMGYFCTVVVSPEKAKKYEENVKSWATK